MDFFNRGMIGLLPDSPKEIEERLRRRYLDRLGQRVKRLRRLLIERNWEELRTECAQVANSGETFGFKTVTTLAHVAQKSIPNRKISKAATPTHTKEAAEVLIHAIDTVLIENSVYR